MDAVPQKVLKYESFINDVLKEHLKKTEFDIDQTLTDIADLVLLQNIMQTLQENNFSNNEGLKSKVDIGCNFYMQAFVPDPSKLLLDIGLGYFVELSQNEALVILKKKIDMLNKKLEILKGQSANTKAHIKLVLHGIHELQQLK